MAMLRRVLLVLPALLLAVSCADPGDDGPVGDGGADVGVVGDAAALPTEWVDDPDCDEETIGDDGGTLVAALVVDDGTVVGLCAGEPDERLDAAWAELTAIVPPAQLADIGVFGGFDDPESDVLAFATMVGTSNDRFAIMVNLPMAEEDPDQFRLTLAHEVSHVFSQTPDQLDVDVDPADCATLHNGNGCFRDDSLLMEWIDRFWSDEQLASIPDPTVGDEAGAAKRCSSDAGFPGSYAASSPEEDFAESFAAYVFDVDVPDAVRPRLEFFEERPEFRAFREQALADRRGLPESGFDECGI